MIGIRTPESAVWHALLTKSQAISSIQLPEAIETYLSCLLIRAMTVAPEARFNSASFSQRETRKDAISHGLESDGSIGQDINDSDAEDELHMIGDECLVLAGLMPERAIREEIPVSYFVNVAIRAYSQLSQEGGDPIYHLLADHLIECIDVLHTLREIEEGSSCLDPLNAFELWQDAGSAHAWHYLTNMTNAQPVREVSNTLN